MRNGLDNCYLAKPTGRYGIGYTDHPFIDTKRSPEIFAIEQNKGCFSDENTACKREIMARIYYPTNNKIEFSDPYYKPQILALKSLAQLDFNITSNDLEEINALRSFSHKDVEIYSGQKFPVVFFSHGMNQCVQSYENVITNLVSHGYIVVGINSLFIGSNIELPNGKIVNVLQRGEGDKNVDDLMDRILPIQMDDIGYIIDQMYLLQQNDLNVFSSMDLQNIAGVGHSLGATAIANLARIMPNLFKAAVGFDSDMNPHSPEVQPFAIPFLHQISGSRYIRIPWWDKQFKPVFNLNKNNFLVGIAPNQDILMRETSPFYSLHSEFGDLSTIKNMKVFKDANVNIEKIHGYPLFGYGKSEDIINSINIPLVKFLDTYLKNQPADFEISHDSPLKENLVFIAGPATF